MAVFKEPVLCPFVSTPTNEVYRLSHFCKYRCKHVKDRDKESVTCGFKRVFGEIKD